MNELEIKKNLTKANEDKFKKQITDRYEPVDLWSVDYLIKNVLGEATTEQLYFIQAAIKGYV